MKPFLIFLLVLLFFASLSTILLELALTRVFSIILWYDYAFMAISVAFFGLGIGSLVIHIQKDSAKWKSRYERKEQLSSRIIYFAIAYAISVPAFVFLISVIPPSTSNVHLYYLASSMKNRDSTTLLWGVNVVASIIGTVLAATLAMVIGFSGNLLFGLGMYAGAAVSALLALLTIKRAQVAVMGDRQ